jgi:uncharacterized protein YkwD
MQVHLRASLLMAGLFFAACNVVTGSDGLGVGDGEEGSGNETIDDLSSGSGANSPTGGPTGSTGGNGSGGSTGVGGDPSTSGSGGTTSTGGSGTTGSGAGGPSPCNGIDDTNTPLDSEEQAFLVIINDYRQQNGLGPVTACTSLNRAAQLHSEDLRDQDYFSHDGLNGSDPYSRSCDACYSLGCGPQTAMAENIAAGNSGAQGTFTQWQNSAGHNANMLGTNFTQIGIGRATGGGTYGSYWTNVFGGDTEPSCN